MTERKPLDKKAKIRLVITITVLVIFLTLVTTLLIHFWPYIKGLIAGDEAIKNTLLAKFQSWGPWAWVLLIFCMILQIIIAILPNGIFTIIAGMIYGPFWSVIITLVGTTIGCYIVIVLVKFFGKDFANIFIDVDQKLSKFKILEDERRILIMMFGYLLLPFLPDDFLAFIVPFTKVKVKNFLIVNFIARIPSTVISAYFGDSLITGNYIVASILIGVAVLVGLLCMIFSKQIEKLLLKIKFRKKETTEK